MVLELLDTIRNVPLEKLEKTVFDNLKLEDGYYFILHNDGELEGPYIQSKKQQIDNQKTSWFLIRDFFSKWINNDANKCLKDKNYLSSTYLLLAFRYEKISKLEEAKKNVLKAICEQNEKSKSIPELENFIGITNKSVIEEKMNQLFCSVPNAIKKINETTDVELKKEKIKIFFNTSTEEYISEGKKYIFSKLFNQGTHKVVDGKTIGPSTFCTNLNHDKKFVICNEMKYREPIDISLENLYRLYLYNIILQKKQESGICYIKYDNSDLSFDNSSDINGYKITFGPKFSISNFEEIHKQTREFDYNTKNYVRFKKFNSMPIKVAIKKFVLDLHIKKDKNEFDDLNYFCDEKDNEMNLFLQKYEPMFEDYVEFGEMSDTLYRELWKKTYLKLRNMNPLDDFFTYNAMQTFNTFLNIKYKKFKGAQSMIDINEVSVVKNDEDYYFLAGQLAYYLSEKAATEKAKNTNISNFIRLNSDNNIKINLRNLMSKYQVATTNRYRKLVSLVFGYTPKKFIIYRR